jgi:hypothetical protein
MAWVELKAFYTSPGIDLIGGYLGHPSCSLGGSKGGEILQRKGGTALEVAMSRYNDYAGSTEYPYRLFPSFSAERRQAGAVIHRAIMIQNLGDEVTNPTLWLEQPSSGCVLEVQYAGIGGRIPAIAKETDDPGGVFSSPTSGVPMVLPSPWPVNEIRAFWFRLTVPPGVAAHEYLWAYHTAVDEESGSRFRYFKHTLRSNVVSLDVQKAPLHGVYAGGLEVIVVRTSDCIGGLADPADNLVWVLVEQPDLAGNIGAFGTSVPRDFQTPAAIIGKCHREGLGTYTFEFNPPIPGYYTLTFYTDSLVAQSYRNVQP